VQGLLDLCSEKTPALEQFARQLLTSPRTDPVLKRAGALLYVFAGESVPEPYDHALALQRFFPTPKAKVALPPAPTAAAPKKKLHTIEPGDNLWKIARKYRVSVEEIMRANRLDSEKLRPGKQLEIPEPVKK
jgi:nucleoid-associated protein YgaU